MTDKGLLYLMGVMTVVFVLVVLHILNTRNKMLREMVFELGIVNKAYDNEAINHKRNLEAYESRIQNILVLSSSALFDRKIREKGELSDETISSLHFVSIAIKYVYYADKGEGVPRDFVGKVEELGIAPLLELGGKYWEEFFCLLIKEDDKSTALSKVIKMASEREAEISKYNLPCDMPYRPYRLIPEEEE